MSSRLYILFCFILVLLFPGLTNSQVTGEIILDSIWNSDEITFTEPLDIAYLPNGNTAFVIEKQGEIYAISTNPSSVIKVRVLDLSQRLLV